MKKKLERSEEKAVISGVLASLADYFGQDPTLFRVMAVAFLIVTGLFPGLLLYIAAWVFIPKRDTTAATVETKTSGAGSGNVEYEVIE